MTATILSFLSLLAGADATTATPRRPNPIAPSLPLLTDDEESKLDRVIDRFMLADTGKLRGEEAKAAVRDFDKLGPEAIPALIRGLNRAARIEHSCPAVIIGKKLQRMLSGSRDVELLEFARDEIGSGVGRSRHQAVLQDLRVACMLHKNALLRAGIMPARSASAMTTAELAAAVGKEKGPRLKEMLAILEKRRGPEVLQGLALAAANPDKEVQKLARQLLDQHLYNQTVPFVRNSLKDNQPEVRQAAIRLIAARLPALGGDLIDLLADADGGVRDAAHQALVQLNKGEDLGPTPDTGARARDRAQEHWRAWWQRQSNR